MSVKGIKKDHEEIAPQGDFDIPNTGPALRVVTQDGRNPSSQNIPITNRTDHHRLAMTSMGSSTSPSPESGKTGNGPTFK